ELKRYKQLADHTNKPPRRHRDDFRCKNTGAEDNEASLEPELALGNPFQLTQSHRDFITPRKTHIHQRYIEEVPVAKSVERLAKFFEGSERATFQDLLPAVCKAPDFVSTFLALLELTRMQFTSLRQPAAFGPLGIQRRMKPEEMVRANDMIRGLSWG